VLSAATWPLLMPCSWSVEMAAIWSELKPCSELVVIARMSSVWKARIWSLLRTERPLEVITAA
jgi:hypothetical protein